MTSDEATTLRFWEVEQVPCPRSKAIYDALMRTAAIKRSESYKRFVIARGNGCEYSAYQGLLLLAEEVPLEQEFICMRLNCSTDEILPWLDVSCGIGPGPTFSLKGTLETVLKDGTPGPVLKVTIPGLSIDWSEDQDHPFEAPQDFVMPSVTVRQTVEFWRRLRNGRVGLCETETEIELWADNYHGPANVYFYGEVCPPKKL